MLAHSAIVKFTSVENTLVIYDNLEMCSRPDQIKVYTVYIRSYKSNAANTKQFPSCVSRYLTSYLLLTLVAAIVLFVAILFYNSFE